MSPKELLDEYQKMDWKDQVRFTINFNRLNKQLAVDLDELKNKVLMDLNSEIKMDNRNGKINSILGL
jgi:hypothetical protein